MKRLRLLVRDLFRRDRFEREMRDELDAYLDLSVEARMREGQPEDAARRAARLELGGVEQARERLRAERSGARLDTVFQDVRYALRLMQRQPGFTLVSVLTLALGIGANTAVMSVVRSVLLAPLPFADSDRLVRLRIIQTDASGRDRELSLVPAYFHGIRERSRLLERVAAQRLQNLTLSGSDRAERVVAIGVSDQWSETLGVGPLLGRTFSEDEQREGSAARVVVLAHGFWLRQFGSDPSIQGRSIRLNGEPYTVIGVMPAQFRYPYEADLWFPISIPPAALTPGDLNAPARMRTGVTRAELDAELARLTDELHREFPTGSRIRLAGIPMHEEFARDPNRSIAALAVAVGFVLLLACVNLAMLLMARGGSRAREIALRTALGAGRRRQIRQLLTESAVLAASGGIVGVAMAFGVSRWLGTLIPARLSEVIQQVEIDGIVLAASALLCVFTGLLFGIVPALRLTRHAPAEVLKDGGRLTGRTGGRPLNVLVVGEAALAMVLLAGAALMAQNFARLLTADVGYDPSGLIRLNLSLSDASYVDPGRRVAAVRQILERIEGTPGIVAAGVTSLQPIPRTRANTGMSLEPDSLRDPVSPLPLANRRLVTPAYFETMGVRLVAGRAFTELDGEASQPVVVVNEAAVRRFWPGEDPIGRRVRPGPRGSEGAWHVVVGVVSNMAEPDDAGMRETIYQPYAQASATLPPGVWITTSASLMVRTTGDAAAAIDAVRGSIRAVDPSLPLFDIAGMETALVAPLSGHRFGATLFVVFGAFGLLAAILGTYGVVAFSVSRRVPEFGVRLALGASPSQLLRSVMFEGLRWAALGIAAGLVASLALSRLLAAVVSEVSPRDPATLAAVAAIILAAAAAACLGPAVRATRVDPIEALRMQ
ncbi:MAG TPA: ABC transporter permease [Vicinamibacterales bacterium]|nr:ABC transporter permease [Vicinamibacterales bacterium]